MIGSPRVGLTRDASYQEGLYTWQVDAPWMRSLTDSADRNGFFLHVPHALGQGSDGRCVRLSTSCTTCTERAMLDAMETRRYSATCKIAWTPCVLQTSVPLATAATDPDAWLLILLLSSLSSVCVSATQPCRTRADLQRTGHPIASLSRPKLRHSKRCTQDAALYTNRCTELLCFMGSFRFWQRLVANDGQMFVERTLKIVGQQVAMRRGSRSCHC